MAPHFSSLQLLLETHWKKSSLLTHCSCSTGGPFESRVLTYTLQLLLLKAQPKSGTVLSITVAVDDPFESRVLTCHLLRSILYEWV